MLAKNKINLEEIKNTTFSITIGYGDEVDAAVKFAFEKYWKLSPLKYMVPDPKAYYGNQTNFYLVGYEEKKYQWTAGRFRLPNISYEPDFDDYRKGEKLFGVDNTPHMVAIKVIPFIMCYAAEVKRASEMGSDKYWFFEGLKDKVKNYKVIIQKESLANDRMTELPFKTYLKSYEFLSSDDIDKKIRSQESTENTALLFIGQDWNEMHVSIIDIKTGDLLYRSSIRSSEFNDKTMTNLLKGLENQ